MTRDLPYSEIAHAFLDCVAEDISAVGIPVSIEVARGQVSFSAEIPRHPQPESLLAGLRVARSRQLESDRKFIDTFEASRLFDSFRIESAVDAGHVDPILKFCRSRSDHAQFRYAISHQGIPHGPRPGRQLRFLLVDNSPKCPQVMGAGELSSSLYSLRCRDEMFGWTAERSEQKLRGLRMIADLSSSVATPAYSHLRVVKLIALLAASNEVSDAFALKYQDDLCAIFATCGTGIHCATFNRIMTCRGGLYRRIGETGGYSTALYRKRTIDLARLIGAEKESKDSFKSADATTIRILRRALARCSLPAEPFLRLGVRKGVYAAVLGDPTTSAQMSTTVQPWASRLDLAESLDYWSRVHVER